MGSTGKGITKTESQQTPVTSQRRFHKIVVDVRICKWSVKPHEQCVFAGLKVVQVVIDQES